MLRALTVHHPTPPGLGRRPGPPCCRANAAQLHKMEALHQKQQAVLRRKTEEAEAARKRLKVRAASAVITRLGALSFLVIRQPCMLERDSTRQLAGGRANALSGCWPPWLQISFRPHGHVMREQCSHEQLPAFHLSLLQELEQRRSQAVSRPGTAATAAPADRPTTAPAAAPGAAPAAPAARPPPAMERSISVPGAPTSVDCQPNQMAPLLRDEKSRREWVERELDTCCASYDLQVGLGSAH